MITNLISVTNQGARRAEHSHRQRPLTQFSIQRDHPKSGRLWNPPRPNWRIPYGSLVLRTAPETDTFEALQAAGLKLKPAAGMKLVYF